MQEASKGELMTLLDRDRKIEFITLYRGTLLYRVIPFVFTLHFFQWQIVDDIALYLIVVD
jgi:hypothetical protein